MRVWHNYQNKYIELTNVRFFGPSGPNRLAISTIYQPDLLLSMTRVVDPLVRKHGVPSACDGCDSASFSCGTLAEPQGGQWLYPMKSLGAQSQ